MRVNGRSGPLQAALGLTGQDGLASLLELRGRRRTARDLAATARELSVVAGQQPAWSGGYIARVARGSLPGSRRLLAAIRASLAAATDPQQRAINTTRVVVLVGDVSGISDGTWVLGVARICPDCGIRFSADGRRRRCPLCSPPRGRRHAPR